MGDFKVQLVCKKCHHTWEPSGWEPIQDHGTWFSWEINASYCPECRREHSYGPITKELLSEALILVADDWYKRRASAFTTTILYGNSCTMQKELAGEVSQFILRLLNILDDGQVEAQRFFDPDANQRQWLLGIARGE